MTLLKIFVSFLNHQRIALTLGRYTQFFKLDTTSQNLRYARNLWENIMNRINFGPGEGGRAGTGQEIFISCEDPMMLRGENQCPGKLAFTVNVRGETRNYVFLQLCNGFFAQYQFQRLKRVLDMPDWNDFEKQRNSPDAITSDEWESTIYYKNNEPGTAGEHLILHATEGFSLQLTMF